MNNIVVEIEERKTKKSINSNSFIGPEIKRRRILLDKTLGAISEGTCSVSYLSKIENNIISPNVPFLTDICAKVSLSINDVLNLSSLDGQLEEMIKLFFFRDGLLDDIFIKNQGFDNYKVDLMHLIYSDFHKEDCGYLFKRLSILSNTMNDEEFCLFAYFYLKYHFRDILVNDYLLSIDNSIEMCSNKYLKSLFKIEKLRIMDISKSSTRVSDYFELLAYLNQFDFHLLDYKIKKDMFVMLLKKEENVQFGYELDKLSTNNPLKTEMKLLYDFFHSKNDNVLIPDEFIFIKALYATRNNQEKDFNKYISILESLNYDEQVIVFLNYYNLSNNHSKNAQYDYLVSTAYPSALYHKDQFLVIYYAMEMAKCQAFFARYKRAMEIIISLQKDLKF